MQKTNGIIEIDLLRLLSVLLSKVWIIILSCILCGAATFAYANFYVDPTYQSSALFYVNNGSFNIGGSSYSISSGDLSASQSLVDTYVVILKTRNTLNTVIDKANLNYSYEELYDMISASAVNSTEVFKVTVTSKSAKEACDIANAIAEVLPDKISTIVTGSGSKIVDYAVVDNDKVAPDVLKYTAVGILIGFVLSSIVIILIDLFDDTIKDDSYLINTYKNIPVLANIPDLGSEGTSGYYSQYYFSGDNVEQKIDKKKDNKPQDDGELSVLCSQMHFDAKEAYKMLRTNINFSLPENECRKIGITSAIRGEGKSTVAINLAYTLAQTKAKVLLIDMDMRLPSIARKLQFKQDKGLSDLLVGDFNFDNVIVTHNKYNNWDILSSGTIPPVPSELISSKGMANLMKELSKIYDYIICDLPPVNVVSDASAAKEILDGFILNVRQDFSDKKSLDDCIRQLSLIEANSLGFVLSNTNNISRYGKNYSKYYKKYKKYGYKEYGYYGKESSKKK